MDAPNELEQLDASLSQMTDLLLSGETADGVELAGDYRSAAEADETAAPEQPLDAGRQVEQAQAAVAAAMANVADAIEAESASREESGPQAASDPAAAAPQRDPALAAAEPVAEAAMAAVSEDLEVGGSRRSSAPAERPQPLAAPSAVSAPSTAARTPEPDQAEPAKPTTESESSQEGLQGSPGRTPAASTAPAESSVQPEPAAPGEHEPIQPHSSAGSAQRGTPAQLVPKQAAAMIGSGLCSLLAIALEPVGSRLTSAPRTIRHSIAWLAVWTAFNAACVWSYIVLFRSAPPSDGESPMVEIQGGLADGESRKSPELTNR